MFFIKTKENKTRKIVIWGVVKFLLQISAKWMGKAG